jgi:hypothetical protein
MAQSGVQLTDPPSEGDSYFERQLPQSQNERLNVTRQWLTSQVKTYPDDHYQWPGEGPESDRVSA